MRKAKPPTMSAKTMKSIVSGATKVTSKLKMKGKVKDLDKDGDSKKDTDKDGM